jgi:hypothetical protein
MLAFPGRTTQLFGLFGALGFLAAIIAAFIYLVIHWSTSRLYAIAPLLTIFLLPYASSVAGHSIAKVWFVTREIERYEAAASWVKSQNLPTQQERLKLPPEFASLAYVTEAHRHADGTVAILFVYSGAFPVKHFAHVYSSSGQWDDHLGNFRHGVRVAPNWFDSVD